MSAKNKNQKASNREHRLQSKDFFQTPEEAVQLFLDVVNIDRSKTILEPCCGKCAISNVLQMNGYVVNFYDLYQTGDFALKDFFTEDQKYDIILTNPPYLYFTEFLTHALGLATDVYLLLPLNYLHGKNRYNSIYSKNILQSIYIYTRYIHMSEDYQDKIVKKGQLSYAWYHFSLAKNTVDPTIKWIDLK